MPSAASVVQRLESLLHLRKTHADAIAAIDQMLARAAGILTGGRPRGRPPASASAPAKRGRKRRRRQFATSGNESILAFVRDHPGASTQEVKKHWASEGRGGGADNALSLLTKAKKLKRTQVEGVRGGSYSLP
jgi:hypothetical protein